MESYFIGMLTFPTIVLWIWALLDVFRSKERSQKGSAILVYVNLLASNCWADYLFSDG
nr:hypothetical protein [Echinicola arenosa]